MKIVIIGAAGRAGRLIAQEAARRGHEVLGVGRSPKPGVDRVKDVSDIDSTDIADADVVVDALGFFTPDTLAQHTSSVLHLADVLSGSPTRLLVVGGAGSLYVDPEHRTRLFETPDFPAEYHALASAQAAQLDALRGRDDVAWTYISPAADFQADGERAGGYVLAGEELETGADGNSVISYADYAIAVIDEAEQGRHPRQRISVHAE
ncbi:NAD(P)-dependent oxidoreductase [Actinomyces capricornis]|uniref:Dihydrodipicolinate reductase n=1 Tax=Actinomyces capricornis TaxID=2755559 RepID=A0ABN6K6B9_9ACTO|nr:NAD(P)H-binding protein [Actinomyces capricornis]BDA63540.1 dihydrodipicolinate reductase [Actinomyces capricornis]